MSTRARKTARSSARAPRARAKAASAESLRASQARAARAALTDARSAYLIARDAYAAVRREWPERVRGSLVQLAAAYRAAAIDIRERSAAERVAWLEAWKLRKAQALADLREKYRAERDRIRSEYRGRRGEARELARARAAERAQRAEVAKGFRTAAQRAAGSSLAERLSEARDVARATIEARAIETSSGATVPGAELLEEFDRWSRSTLGRKAYQAAVRKLRAKHPRGGWRWSDAGDEWAVSFLEWAAENADELAAQLATQGDATGRCLDRVTREIMALGLDPEAADREWNRRSADCV